VLSDGTGNWFTTAWLRWTDLQNSTNAAHHLNLSDKRARREFNCSLDCEWANFASTSVVDWNSGDRATSFKSSTQLTATITAADLATSGTAGVTVATAGDPLNPVSNTVFFTINP
jgi:hypothetical protein